MVTCTNILWFTWKVTQEITVIVYRYRNIIQEKYAACIPSPVYDLGYDDEQKENDETAGNEADDRLRGHALYGDEQARWVG